MNRILRNRLRNYLRKSHCSECRHSFDSWDNPFADRECGRLKLCGKEKSRRYLLKIFEETSLQDIGSVVPENGGTNG